MTTYRIDRWRCQPGLHSINFSAGLSLVLDRDLRAETAREGTRFIALNGAHCPMPGHLLKTLQDGDDVQVLPFVAGG